MSIKIGFAADCEHNEKETQAEYGSGKAIAKKSLVRVYFEQRNASYSYYNDAFDLKCGDYVWVEGKLENIRGVVVDISYNFKIKLSDYKRVIGLANSDIKGCFRLAESYFVTDKDITEAVKSWFLPPVSEEETVSCNDGSGFLLSELENVHFSSDEADAGAEYFRNNKTVFIGISNGHGTAITYSTKAHLLEFDYKNGFVSNLICDCYDVDFCRHKLGVMLTLRHILGFVEKNYKDINPESNGFSAIRKVDFFQFAVDTKTAGTITLG